MTDINPNILLAKFFLPKTCRSNPPITSYFTWATIYRPSILPELPKLPLRPRVQVVLGRSFAGPVTPRESARSGIHSELAGSALGTTASDATKR